MKTFKMSKERYLLLFIAVLSAILNFTNLNIEGLSNQYYAAGVKSMTMSWKNFFFVALDPAGFVTIDKPPFAFWMQALSAKIFGFSGWSILIPQALAGVLSVILIYHIVKKSFGSAAGLISALCLAVTPVFVAVSRNNTMDNQLVFALLLACWAISIAAEKGKFRYLALSMVFIGLGFNIKMLEAYMIIPAIYATYLFSNGVSLGKRIIQLIAGTAILLVVSLSWALIVDSVPASERPFVGSSGNNTEIGLITGHNGTERVNLSSLIGNSQSDDRSGRGAGGQFGGAQNGAFPRGQNGFNNMQPPSGNGAGTRGGDNGTRGANDFGGGFRGGPGGNNGGLAGTFGNEIPAGITRLFSKNILSDQIVWFIPLAVLGFIAAAIREKLKFRLDTKRKQALVLWFMWFLPEFVYFSFNTGLFHSYYLTMMAAPIAALTGIGTITMWEMYKEGGWKKWFLPVALLLNGAVQLLMLTYFINNTKYVKVLMGLVTILCFVSSIALAIMNFIKSKNSEPEIDADNYNMLKFIKLKKVLLGLALAGVLVVPATGSSAAMFYAVNSSMPAAGLELLPTQQSQNTRQAFGGDNRNFNDDGRMNGQNNNYSDLVKFLNDNKVNGKSQLVVGSANTAESITLNTDIYVGSLSGFMGNDKVMSLDQFKQLVKNGEVRFVLANSTDARSRSNSEIMNWVKENGKLVSYSSSNTGSNTDNQVYDLKDYMDNSGE